MIDSNAKIIDALKTLRRILSEDGGLTTEISADTYEIRIDYEDLANLKDLYHVFENEEISDSLI